MGDVVIISKEEEDNLPLTANEDKVESGQEEHATVIEMPKPKINYASWEVAGKEYRLKLCSCYVTKLEQAYKKNIMDLLNDGMPMLSDMLNITFYALKAYPDRNGKISTMEEVFALFDTYVDEGGSQTEFVTNVFMKIYEVSGFLSRKQREKMEKVVEKMKKNL